MDTVVIDLSAFDAFLFDLDGVITRTAGLHASAWKTLFDEYLQARGSSTGTPFVPFDNAERARCGPSETRRFRVK